MDFRLPKSAFDEIASIERAFLDKSRTDLVAMMDRTIDILQACNGVEFDVQLHPSKVFAHHKNRDTEVLNAFRAQTRINGVVETGFSWAIACKDAFCFQDHPIKKDIAKTADRITSMSGLFAKYTAANVSHGSVGSSHFNHSLEQALQEVPCQLDKVSENGKMSRAKIEQQQPGFKLAFEKGLKWTVTRWEIESMFPALPLLFQSALTAGGQLQEGDIYRLAFRICIDVFRACSVYAFIYTYIHNMLRVFDFCFCPGEGWPQMLQKISNEFELQSKTSSRKVDLSIVERAVLASQPKRGSDVPDMAKFVQLWGGGKQCTFAKEVILYMQTGVIKPDGRHIASSFFNDLNKIHKNFTPTQLPVLFVHAALLTHASDGQVVDGICRGISHGDINAMGSKLKNAVISSNQVLMRARSTAVREKSLQAQQRCELLLELYQRVVRCTIEKAQDTEYDSIDKCVTAFSQGIANIVASDETLPSVSAGPSSNQTKPADSSLETVVQYDNVGNPVGAHQITMTSAGFKVGGTVALQETNVAHPKLFTLKSISEDDGTITLNAIKYNGTASATDVTVTLKNLMKNYKATKAKVELCKFYPNAFCANGVDLQVNALKGVVAAALHGAQTLHSTAYDVVLQTSPKESVWSNARYDKGDITLVPSTLNVCAETNPQKALKTGAIVATIAAQQTRFVLLRASASKEFVAPFWHVRVVHMQGDANCMLKTIDMSCQVPHEKSSKADKPRIVNIPIIVNTKVISEGSELILYRPEEAKAEPKTTEQLMVVEPAGKRQKK